MVAGSSPARPTKIFPQLTALTAASWRQFAAAWKRLCVHTASTLIAEPSPAALGGHLQLGGVGLVVVRKGQYTWCKTMKRRQHRSARETWTVLQRVHALPALEPADQLLHGYDVGS